MNATLEVFRAPGSVCIEARKWKTICISQIKNGIIQETVTLGRMYHIMGATQKLVGKCCDAF